MSQYTRLPAQRLAYLARRYLHEDSLRRIAEKVRQQQSVDSDLIHTLDKMEKLEEKVRLQPHFCHLHCTGVILFREPTGTAWPWTA